MTENTRHYFGTDGVRGVANDYLTPELTLNLAMAAATVLKGGAHHPKVLIGKDTRQSGDMLESALATGFASMGWDVELLGVVPTPAVAWLVTQRQAAMGAMISASHNPAPDNGIKFFSANGFKLSDGVEHRIEAMMSKAGWQRQTGKGVGRIRHLSADAWEPYVDFLLSTDLPEFKRLKIGIDLAHGAMVDVAPAVFNCLDLEAHYLHRSPDGMNINDNCGSTHLEPLKDFVRAQNLDLGIAFDGDGDRCLVVGPNGEDIDGDRVMYLCSRYLPHLADETAVVATVMSNLGLELALKAANRQLLRTAVGDRYVLEQMERDGHLLGGEQSGHLIFRQYQVTGDGLLTALQLLNAITRSGKSLPELLTDIPTYPQLLRNVIVQPQWQRGWVDHDGLKKAITAAEARLEGTGRLLVRASGTEPKLRVMAEGQDQNLVNSVVDDLVSLIQQEMGAGG